MNCTRNLTKVFNGAKCKQLEMVATLLMASMEGGPMMGQVVCHHPSSLSKDELLKLEIPKVIV